MRFHTSTALPSFLTATNRHCSDILWTFIPLFRSRQIWLHYLQSIGYLEDLLFRCQNHRSPNWRPFPRRLGNLGLVVTNSWRKRDFLNIRCPENVSYPCAPLNVGKTHNTISCATGLSLSNETMIHGRRGIKSEKSHRRKAIVSKQDCRRPGVAIEATLSGQALFGPYNYILLYKTRI